MILRYILGTPKIHEFLESQGPFGEFGPGRKHGRRHGHRHDHDDHDQHDVLDNLKAFAGFGPFGGRAGRRGGFGGGRKISSGDLQVVVLALLAEKASYGYELIKDLEDKSGGFYIPSPGVIYPALTYLEELGYATVETDGARKRYNITEEGHAHLELNRASADAIMAGIAQIASRMDDVRRAMHGDEEDGGIHAAIHAARHALRAALHAKRRSSVAEQKRIADVLERAAAEILKGPKVDA